MCRWNNLTYLHKNCQKLEVSSVINLGVYDSMQTILRMTLDKMYWWKYIVLVGSTKTVLNGLISSEEYINLTYCLIMCCLAAFASRILGLINPSVVMSSQCCAYMLSRGTASNKKMKMAKVMSGNYEEDVCRKFIDLSSTLEKLCVWEEKLYEEVKVWHLNYSPLEFGSLQRKIEFTFSFWLQNTKANVLGLKNGILYHL